MLLSVSYRTVDFQDGSGPNRIKWNGCGPFADHLQTKQMNSIKCTIAFTFYIYIKKGGGGHTKTETFWYQNPALENQAIRNAVYKLNYNGICLHYTHFLDHP